MADCVSGITVKGSRNRGFSEPILDRCRKRLASWKANYLSFGGRITLTKATPSKLPIYYLSLFRSPKRVAAEIERLQKHFLWRGQQDFKPHLIKWQIVSKDKEDDGLGLGGTLNRNTALLGKWLWRFSME